MLKVPLDNSTNHININNINDNTGGDRSADEIGTQRMKSALCVHLSEVKPRSGFSCFLYTNPLKFAESCLVAWPNLGN
jgi:hypothetical protein